MATSLTSTARSSVNWNLSDVLAVIGDTQNNNSFAYSKQFANGTGANQADRVIVKNGTIAGGGNTTFDLAGSLTDFFGNVITLVRVKVLYFELTTGTTASDVSLGGDANPWATWLGAVTDKVKVRNGGSLCLVAPDAAAYTVTAGTGDILKVTNNDGANVATYKLVIIGASA